ncbi:VacJ family lipoprotein [Sphingomonas tabacisoli]|uniref:VacJ family lipoprotein n=1 Tax=Sphingomonas tabacisoli TaxID=2249466 RepID=A0ABW4I5U7_9SPHN
MSAALALALALQSTAPVPETAPITVQHAPGDPLEKFNRRMFRSFQGFDRTVMRPVAMGYKHGVPKPVRSGLRNALSNLGEPIVFLNYLLQLKPGKAVETATRFLINSTLGFGGLVDMAKTPGVNLPHRPNGFGDTLGFYGVKPGPYLFLPVIGPTTLRDLVGAQADGVVLPVAVGNPFKRPEYIVGSTVVSSIDKRAESDDELKALLDQAVDPYASLRSAYLQDREAEIRQLKGKKVEATPGTELDEPLEDPAKGATPSPELEDPLTDPAASPPKE